MGHESGGNEINMERYEHLLGWMSQCALHTLGHAWVECESASTFLGKGVKEGVEFGYKE